MKDSRKCSVITVSYNSSKTISRTIESVLKQTYPNIEYLIVDGGSTDGTVEIIKRYEPLFDGRLRWISEHDNGIYYAMNKGIDMATGDLIGILNSDDYYEVDAVETMMDQLGDRCGIYVFYGMLRVLRDDVEKCIDIHSHRFMREGAIAHPTCFITKELYDRYGAYDTAFVSASDYDFMLRMSENSAVTFEPVYKVITNFAEGGMSASSRAYYDLLKVKVKHGIITKKEYDRTVLKCRIYDFFHK